MLAAILAAALLPAISAELPKEFRRSTEPVATRVAYVRGPSGRYYLGMIRPLFDVTTAGGISTVAGGGGGSAGGASAITMNDDVALKFGTAGDNTRPAIIFNTAETVDTGMLLTGTVSNHWVIAENQDKTFDYAHGAQTNPTVFVHSAAQSTTAWIGFTHDGTSAVIQSGAGGLTIFSTTNQSATFAPGHGLRMRSDAAEGIGFSANTSPNNTANDTYITKEGPQVFQFSADVISPLPYTLKGTDARAGLDTNVAGGSVTFAPGRSTGTAAGGDFILQRDPTAQASGTVHNALIEALRFRSQAKALTDATNTSLIQVGGLGLHTHAGGKIEFTARATDGTNDQATTGAIYWACVDTTAGAGGETAATGLVGTNVSTASAGTLTCTAASTTGTDVCTVQINCDTSLSPTSLDVTYTAITDCRTCTITPQ